MAKSLAHTKYRRKGIYNKLRKDIQGYIKELYKWKEGHMMPNHVHVLLEMPPKMSVSYFMGYLRGKSSFDIRKTYKFEI